MRAVTKSALGIALLAAVAGCAGKTCYTKPGFTQAEWNRDLAQCTYETTASTQNVNYGYSTVFGQALDQALRRQQLMDLCLKARGYYVAPEATC